MSSIKIFPSLISGDLLHLESEIKKLEPHCAGFHIDVMDFHFVPNLTWGPAFVNAIRNVTKKQIWVDLLVDEPDHYLDRFSLNPGDIVSIHYESTYPNEIFNTIKNKGWNASLALDPKTPIEVIEPFIEVVDHVLLMSVIPGFSGQAFIQDSVERIKKLNELRTRTGAQFAIGMDGGLNEQTLPLVAPHGLDTAGIASGIFDQPDPIATLKKLGNLR